MKRMLIEKLLIYYVIFINIIGVNKTFIINLTFYLNNVYSGIISDFSNNREKQEWIDTMKNRNIAPIYTEVSVNDKILTLSTCKNNQGKRLVVQAKLIKRQKNKN